MDRRTPLVALTVVVVVASLVPTPGSGEPVAPAGSDKLVHAVGYAALAFAVGWAREDRTTATVALAVGGATLLGGGVELAQTLVPGRDPSAFDGVANALGAGVGAVAWREADRRGLTRPTDSQG